MSRTSVYFLFEGRREAKIIEFRRFNIDDKERINDFFKVHHYEQCDCSFNTLFLWQNSYNTMWAEQDDILFIRAGRGTQVYFMPPFAKEGASFSHGLELIQHEFDKTGHPFMLMGASKEVVEKIETQVPDKYLFTPFRDDWEYIYKTSDLINLSGKKFRMKKNHLNHFLREYGDYVYEPVNDTNMEDARRGISEWFVRHGDIEKEEEAINLAFDNWKALGLKGAVIRIYGKVEAFTCGDLLNENVAHIHFEKANPEVRGLYQAINRDFILNEFKDTEFVNREEDLGIEGLRKAKNEYHPDHFAEKYNVTLK